MSQSILGWREESIHAMRPHGLGIRLARQPTSVDTGQVTATISGHEASYTYGQSDTPTTIATGLAAAINSVDHGFVTATSSGSTISWSSTSGTNDPIAVNVWSNNNQFAHPSFTATATNTGTGGSGASTAYTQFVYSPGGQKIAVVSGGKLVKGTVPLPGGGLAVYNSAGLEFIRHKDWLGSSRLATTWGHAVYAKEAYAPFGETYNEAGTPDRSFTGQDQDTSSGIFDYLFRKYDPVSGRWLSPDPLGWGAASISVPQSLNRYAYVENNPMNAIDPSGLCLFAGQDDASGDPNVPCTLDSIDPYVPDASYNGDAPAPGFFYFDLNTKDDSPGVADVGTGDDGFSWAPSNGPSANTKKIACVADVGINFGLGFIPGYNAAKLVGTAAGLNFNFVQNAISGKSIITAGPNAFTSLAALGSAYYLVSTGAYEAAGGATFLGAASSLGKIASTAGTIANVLNAVSAVNDLYGCLTTP